MRKFLKEELISLAVPIFLELFFMNLLGFFDTFMISKYSQNSVIAVGNATTVIGIFTVLLSVASRGTNVIISQYLGAKQEENALKTLHSGILFNLLLSLILLTVVELFGYELLKMIKVDNMYIDEATTYLSIVAIGMPFISITNCFGAAFRSYKKPKILTISSIISNIFNVICNYILIFGIGGLFKPLGSLGAGIATLLSYILNFLIGYIFLHRLLHKRIFSLKIDLTNLKKLLHIGLPSALESFVYTFSNMILMSAVNTLDSLNPGLAAGRSYLNQLLGFIFQLSMSFGLANQILVGHSVGKGDADEAKRSTYKAIMICLPIVEFLVLILIIFGREIFSIYAPNNNAELPKFEIALKEIIHVLPFIFLLEFGRGMNLILVNALQATGDVIFPLVMAVISMLLFMALGSYLFGVWLNLGLLGIYIGSIIDECFRGIVMLIRFKGGKWQRKKLIEA